MKEGLNDLEVKEKLALYGYNELPSAKPKHVGQIAVEVIKEPMFLLLIGCGILYMLLGDYQEGAIMLFTIFIIIFITFYQSQKTEKALEALRKLSSPRALVIRQNLEQRIPGRELVPDDILLLHEGDRIAADAILLDSINLTVDESMLTGESIAVRKQSQSAASNTGDRVYSGTLVVQGKGKAKVIATGINTQFGKIGTSLQGIKEEETRLQKEMKLLIRNLFIIGACISTLVVSAFYYTRGNFIASLLNGLASAMAILPEEFPVVLTIFLALGAWRLSKKNVLTRKPSAIETLGSATVLCSDKTGTITQNKMEIAAIYNGKVAFAKQTFLENSAAITPILSVAMLASQPKAIDPMEIAIMESYEKFVQKPVVPSKLLKEYPLSRDLLAMTRVTENILEKKVIVSSKGAPESIFLLCKMGQQEMNENLAKVHNMAEQGFRVIAVASVLNPPHVLPESQKGFDFEFLGLIALEDPIRQEVPNAIKECKNAGIKVIMITGDFPTTAKSIATQIGLAEVGILTGEELKNLSDTELQQKIKHTNIFARVLPEQKLRIVQALKANKEIVAMTGDGVNDAPALKAAHIGIAMGNKGTDVARESASLVLLDDNFASIVSAIRSGRRIFDNLQKAMSYIMAIHIPIIGLTLLPAFMSKLPLLLMPLHIVFMELIIDPVSSVAFEAEQEEKRIMNRKPRDSNEPFFGAKKIVSSIFQGALLLIMVLSVYFLSIQEGHTEKEVRAIAFSALIVGNIFLIISALSKTRSFVMVILEKNVAVASILSVSIVLLFMIITIPYLQTVFSFQFPGFKHFISSISAAGIMLFVLEFIKYIKNRKI